MCSIVSGLSLDIVVFFFFKQKTAYEMRISDWSSDVCSSDLAARKIGSDIPAKRNGKRARFFPRHARHRPAARTHIFADPGLQHVRVDVRPVAVLCVFDKQPVRGEGQQIDEAIAVDLGHAGIHDDGPRGTGPTLRSDGPTSELQPLRATSYP